MKKRFQSMLVSFLVSLLICGIWQAFAAPLTLSLHFENPLDPEWKCEDVVLDESADETVSLPDLPVMEGYEAKGWALNDQLFQAGTPIENKTALAISGERVDLASLSEDGKLIFQAAYEKQSENLPDDESENTETRQMEPEEDEMDQVFVEDELPLEETVDESADDQDPYTQQRLNELKEMKNQVAAGELDWGYDPQVPIHTVIPDDYDQSSMYFQQNAVYASPLSTEAYAYLDTQEHLLVFNRASSSYVSNLKNTSRYLYFKNFENVALSASQIPWRPMRDQIYRVNFLDEIHPVCAWEFFGWQGNTTAYNHLERLVLDRASNARGLFYSNFALPAIDISVISVSGVKDAYGWFYNDSALSTIACSNMNFSACENMSAMFYGCSALKNIDLSGWNTSKVTTFANMFAWCSSLTDLDLSMFSLSCCISLQGMVRCCASLRTVNMSGWNTAAVQNFGSLFYQDPALESLDINHFDLSNAASLAQTFQGCSSLKSLDLSNWTTPKLISSSYTFAGCTSLESLNIASMDTRNVDASTSGKGLRAYFQDDPRLCRIVFSQNFIPWGNNRDVLSQNPANAALLPAPSSEIIPGNWSGSWWREESQSDAMSPEQFRSGYQGDAMAGTWVWQPQTSVTIQFQKRISQLEPEKAMSAFKMDDLPVFDFEFYVDGKLISKAQSDQNGQVSFDPLVLSKTGIYQGMISEVLTDEQKEIYQIPETVSFQIAVEAGDNNSRTWKTEGLPQSINNSLKPGSLNICQSVTVDGYKPDPDAEMDPILYRISLKNPEGESVSARMVNEDGTSQLIQDQDLIHVPWNKSISLSLPAGTQYEIEPVMKDFKIKSSSKTSGFIMPDSDQNAVFELNDAATVQFWPEAKAVLNGQEIEKGMFEFEFTFPEKNKTAVECNEEGIGKVQEPVRLSGASIESVWKGSIKEIQGNNPEIDYDDALIKMSASVILNPDWSLSLRSQYIKDGAEENEAVFENFIKPLLPAAGMDGMFFSVIFSGFIASAGLIALLRKKRP